jgi:hypothetical protein
MTIVRGLRIISSNAQTGLKTYYFTIFISFIFENGIMLMSLFLG